MAWLACSYGKCMRIAAKNLKLRSFSSDDRGELCRKLAESRERELNALRVALEARKSEAETLNLVSEENQARVEVEELRSALVEQKKKCRKLARFNKQLRTEIEVLKKESLKPAAAQKSVSDEVEKNAGDSEDEVLFSSISERSSEDHQQEFDVSHPWPEWLMFMEHLKQKHHWPSKASEANAPSNKELIKQAAMSFCGMHENILTRVSQDDLVVFASFGCPNTDRKLVNSGKRLRKHLNLAEADVCKFCSFSNTCSRAYVESTHSIVSVESSDLLWLLLQFGFDAVSKPAAERRPLTQHVQATIRNLLKQLVYLAENPLVVLQGDTEIQPGDWRCTSCKKLNFSGSRLCRGCSTPCGQDTLKTGEWKCIKCSYKNNSRAAICVECNVPRPPKELRWGDWECPECHGVNYARNKECFRCMGKQPPFKDRNMIGVNKHAIENKIDEPAPRFTLGVTPWLMSNEEKQASLKK